MKIKPLRDIIVAVALEEVGRAGLLYMPENYKQSLVQHHKALVIASGPNAEEHCPVGSIVHVSETWGESFIYGKRTVKIGRIRDINGVLPDARVKDVAKYLD